MNDSERDALLGRLDERTGTILKRLENGDACMDDLKVRVGKLEGFQSTVLAFVTSITIGLTLVANWVISWLPKGGS
jgi:hypothetical protein